jgi:hypothetical protein
MSEWRDIEAIRKECEARIAKGHPLVGLDPSLILALTDEIIRLRIEIGRSAATCHVAILPAPPDAK